MSLGVGREVMCAVDTNPFKRGKFMAGTGHPVVAPQDLVSDPPHVMVAMHSAYLQEIQANLAIWASRQSCGPCRRRSSTHLWVPTVAVPAVSCAEMLADKIVPTHAIFRIDGLAGKEIGVVLAIHPGGKYAKLDIVVANSATGSEHFCGHGDPVIHEPLRSEQTPKSDGSSASIKVEDSLHG
jgi:hypothetical protein